MRAPETPLLAEMEGAQQTVWAIFLEMERFKYMRGLAKAFECVGLGDALQFPKEDIAGAVRVLRAPESAVRRMCCGAATDHHGHLARSGVARS